ncbi:Hypothetical protein, putative [Bodo saltans]|uniref:Uncharacterized protein n=1 Tax=Bodo saltans TaxID=75058 RepID=A0A0S4JGY5_BODSA|nr:Hypothetical protein, putative [Bodo saltans]|eukprot:CUG90722.1 Hypothetical protein, putative [Bodo saltans]
MNTIVNYCSRCRSGSPCPKLIGLIPGPFVPHHERIAVEKGLVECALLAGFLPPSIMWLRPAEDEVQHPAQSGPVAYEVASYFQNIPDALENPMQTLKMISEKDIQEFSVEMMLVASTLLPSWVSKTLHPVDLRHSTLEKFVARWSARTLYDPDWFVLPVPSTWALQPTSALLSSLASIQTAEAESMLKMISNLTDSTSTVKKSATSDLTWSIVLPTGPESQTLQTGYDRVEHHVQRLIDTNLMKQSTTIRPLSSLEKKKRKCLKVIGSNVSVRARFGWHTENTDAFSDIVVVEQTSLVLLAAENATVVAIDAAQAAVSSTELRWTTFFHYPWVRDNLYHLHNDNILPLLLAVRREEQRERGSSRRSQTADSSYSCRRLVLLPSTRVLQTPLPFALDLFRLAFDQVVVLETQPGNRKDKPLRRLYRGLRPDSEKCNANVSQTDTESSSMPILLDGPIIFGRPPRPFSTEMRNVAPFAHHRIVPMWRETVWEFSTQQVVAATRQSLKVAPASEVMRLYGNMDLLKTIVDDDKKQEIFVTWLIRRRGSRSVDTDGVILGWLADANETLELVHLCHNCVLRIQVCCDGLSFWEQVLLLKRTDILIGVHGAGLLHSIFVDPTPRRIMASTTSGKATAAAAVTPLVVHIGSAHMNHHEQVVIQRLTTLASINRTYRVRYHTTVTSPFSNKNRAASWRDDFHLSATAIHDMLSHALWLYFSSA